MYGCFVTPPDDAAGDLGVVFFHNEGYSTACGHGTIALVTWAIDSGRIAVEPGSRRGRGHGRRPVGPARLHGPPRRRRSRRGGQLPQRPVVRARPRRRRRDVPRPADARRRVRWRVLRLARRPRRSASHVEPRALPELIALQRELRPALERAIDVVHPDEPDLRGIYGVIFWEPVERRAADPAQRHGLRRRRGRSLAVRLRHVGPAGDPPRPRRDRRRRDAPPSIDRRFGLRRPRDRGRSGGRRHARRSSPRSKARPTGPASTRFTLDDRDPLGRGFLLR